MLDSKSQCMFLFRIKRIRFAMKDGKRQWSNHLSSGWKHKFQMLYNYHPKLRISVGIKDASGEEFLSPGLESPL